MRLGRLALGAICAFGLGAGAAQAGLTICNDSAELRSVSIGYKSGDTWVSEGWWQIAPGDCAEPVTGDLQNRYYYLRATAPGRTFAGEGYMFCTQTAAYTIVGDSECVARGYAEEDFARIDTGETARSHTHRIAAAAVKAPGGKTAAGKAPAKSPATQAPVPATPPAMQQPAAAQPVTAGPLRSGLTRGEFGEPFASRLVFQGCDYFDGFEACTFVGNGWKYFAEFGEPTPRAFLEQFHDVPVGTLMDVKGDLTGYGDSSAQLAVSEITELAGQDPYGHFRQAMQGDWVMAESPNETLFIHGAEMHSYMDGGFVDTYYIDLKPSCPDSAGAGPVMVQTSQAHRDTYCYLIDNLAGGWMDLILMGHEARISYRKTD